MVRRRKTWKVVVNGMRLGVAGQECSGCGLGVAGLKLGLRVGGARAEAQATVEGGPG